MATFEQSQQELLQVLVATADPVEETRKQGEQRLHVMRQQEGRVNEYVNACVVREIYRVYTFDV